MVAKADRHRLRHLAGLLRRLLARVGLRRLLDVLGDLGALVAGALVAGALVAGALVAGALVVGAQAGAQVVAQEYHHQCPWARRLRRRRVALADLALAQHVAGLVVGTRCVADLAKRVA